MLILPDKIVCGYCDCSEFGDMKRSPERRAERFEIEFYLEDALTTTADGRVFQIKKDHIQIARPGQIRHSELPFKTAYLKFSASGDLAEMLSSAPEYFCSSHPKTIYDMMSEIILLNETDNGLLLHSRILSLLDLILSDSRIPSERRGRNYETVAAAKRYIELHCQEPISLDDIARSVHLSKIYFHNLFSEAAGISPHKYLINCRIDNAKKLLWSTEISVSEIAERCGFGCQQYFNKVFKKETEMTPVAYRKAFQQKYLL